MSFETELEGTWEEILQHDADLRGRRVRLTVLDAIHGHPDDPTKRRSTGKDLLEAARGWAGDDFEERLAEVYATRSKAKF